MILYHATKSKSAFEAILKTLVLKPGYNVSAKNNDFVHLSRNPFTAGSYALDVIGADTNKAWVFQIEIPDDTILEDDPSGEGGLYNGGWVIHQGPLPISIISFEHIANVQRYEMGM